MTLTSSLVPWAIRQWGGQNNKVRDTLLDWPYGDIVQNSRFESEVGSVSKRDDIAYYNAASLGVGAVKSLYRYYTKTGVGKTLAAYSTTMKVGNDVSGTFSNLKTALTDGKRFSFITYKDLSIWSNGFDAIQVNDASCDVSWELGSCKAALGGTGSVNSANVTYQVTMDNDAYVCGAISNIVAPSSKQVLLTNIPIGPVGTINRKIYRKSSETSGVYKLVATLANNTATTYTDNTADVSAAATIPAVTDPMPKGNMLQLHRERLFIAGDPNNPNRVYYSRPYLPWYIQQITQLDYMDISPDDGDKIMGIPVWLGVLNCIKRNTIRKVYITTPTSGADPDTWYAEDPTVFVGTVAQWSVTVTPYGVWYLAANHWYSYDGVKSDPILDEFDVSDISPTRLTEVVGHWHEENFYAAYSDRDASKNYNDRLLVYNTLRKALSIDTVTVDSFSERAGGDESGDLFYGDSVNGYVYRAEKKIQSYVLRTRPDIEAGTLANILVDGDDSAPFFEIGRTGIIDDLIGTVDGLTGTVDMDGTTGIYISAAFNINAGSLDRVFWNELLPNVGDDVQVYTRSASTQAGLSAASWDGPLSDPNGSTILSAPNTWFQFKFVLTAGTATDSPSVYYAGGYVIKFTYSYGATSAETTVPFTYQTGFKNFWNPNDPFSPPLQDKLMKKFICLYNGNEGTVTVSWETENNLNSGSFVWDLSMFPNKFESFFPANAFGRSFRFKVYKNDLKKFTLKEMHGLYSPEPVIV